MVGSVFAGGPNDAFWLRMQRSQLDATVGNDGYRHCVSLGQASDERLFPGSVIVGQSTAGEPNEHLDGLHRLSAYALANQQSFSDFLVLDSDAFPLAKGWRTLLNIRLAQFGKRYAAAVRTENLDVFPHPCVVYSPSAECLHFRVRKSTNLLGRRIADIVCQEQQFLPLLKSNRRSVHPVLATVYSDLFYHHGCGSRSFIMRAGRYYEEILKTVPDLGQLFDALAHDPGAFLASLLENDPALGARR